MERKSITITEKKEQLHLINGEKATRWTVKQNIYKHLHLISYMFTFTCYHMCVIALHQCGYHDCQHRYTVTLKKEVKKGGL